MAAPGGPPVFADIAPPLDAPHTSIAASTAPVRVGDSLVVDSRHIHPLRSCPPSYDDRGFHSDGWYCDWCTRMWRGLALHCAECKFDLCPDCAEQRYDGAEAQEGEANTLTAVHADATVACSRHEHELREYVGEVGKCSACNIGLLVTTPWWGRHYRCSLEKQCSYKLCARCFDDPAAEGAPITFFTDMFGAPFAACTAALLDSRLQQLLDADDELRAALTEERGDGQPPSVHPTSLQRQCAASQWQLLQALPNAAHWHAVLGIREEYERCCRLFLTRWHSPLPPSAVQRSDILAAELWFTWRRDMVREPRHPHARLRQRLSSRPCDLCGLRWAWRTYNCEHPACSYTQCSRCTHNPHLPTALHFSDLFPLPLLSEGGPSQAAVMPVIFATMRRLQHAAQRSHEQIRQRIPSLQGDSPTYLPPVDAADSERLAAMDAQQLIREDSQRVWTMIEGFRLLERYLWANQFGLEDGAAREQWLPWRMAGEVPTEVEEQGGQAVAEALATLEWAEGHPSQSVAGGTGKSDKQSGCCALQ